MQGGGGGVPRRLGSCARASLPYLGVSASHVPAGCGVARGSAWQAPRARARLARAHRRLTTHEQSVFHPTWRQAGRSRLRTNRLGKPACCPAAQS